MNLPEESAVLSSWKDIARYMGKGVRTVQRWEHHLDFRFAVPTALRIRVRSCSIAVTWTPGWQRVSRLAAR